MHDGGDGQAGSGNPWLTIADGDSGQWARTSRKSRMWPITSPVFWCTTQWSAPAISPHREIVAVVGKRCARDGQQGAIVHAPDDEMRHAHPELRRVELHDLRGIHRLAHLRHHQRRGAIPVEHARKSARRAPGLEVAGALFWCQPGLRTETHQHAQELFEIVGRELGIGLGVAQIVHVGAGFALRLVLDEGALEGARMHAVDDDELGDAVGRGDRGGIGDGRAPVVRHHHERPIG